MKRRICETCFFFDSAGLNNSGWCRHPEREFSAGVRLVVRGNEIACRNGWDADLWVSSEIDPNGAMTSSEEPQPPSAGSDQLTSILPARYEPASPAADALGSGPAPSYREDIVVGHAPYPGYVAPEKDARDLVTNPRLAILRAREQFKSRQKHEGRIADVEQGPPLIVDATNDFPASDWNLPEDDQEARGMVAREDAPFPVRSPVVSPYRQINVVPPVSREEVRRPYPTITSFVEDLERFESIPEQSYSVRVPNAEDAHVNDEFFAEESDVAQADDFSYDFDDYVDAPVFRPRRESLFERYLRERRERNAAVSDSLIARGDYEYGDDIYGPPSELYPPIEAIQQMKGVANSQALTDMPMGDFSTDRQVAQSVDREALSMAAPLDEFLEPAAVPRASSGIFDAPAVRDPYSQSRDRNLSGSPEFPQFDKQEWEPEQDYVLFDEQVTLRADATSSIEDLPRWDDRVVGKSPIAERRMPIVPLFGAEIPKVCRTCRDFRPAESSDRGWCNNSWAFTHRRMVDAESLSCGQSTLGSWWTANDGFWQGPADVARHAQETPLLDRLLASRFDQYENQRRASGGGRP